MGRSFLFWGGLHDNEESFGNRYSTPLGSQFRVVCGYKNATPPESGFVPGFAVVRCARICWRSRTRAKPSRSAVNGYFNANSTILRLFPKPAHSSSRILRPIKTLQLRQCPEVGLCAPMDVFWPPPRPFQHRKSTFQIVEYLPNWEQWHLPECWAPILLPDFLLNPQWLLWPWQCCCEMPSPAPPPPC